MNTFDNTSVSGIYCSVCGHKTYLSKDGTHRRCPNCDDINIDLYEVTC